MPLVRVANYTPWTLESVLGLGYSKAGPEVVVGWAKVRGGHPLPNASLGKGLELTKGFVLCCNPKQEVFQVCDTAF